MFIDIIGITLLLPSLLRKVILLWLSTCLPLLLLLSSNIMPITFNVIIIVIVTIYVIVNVSDTQIDNPTILARNVPTTLNQIGLPFVGV